MTDLVTNPETGETITGRSPRFLYWSASLFFSIVVLGACVEEVNVGQIEGDITKYHKRAVAASAISFIFTLLAVLAHLHGVASMVFVGRTIEGGFLVVLLICWTMTVKIVNETSHGLAVNDEGIVSNGNLYYFSWAGFVTSVILMVGYLRSVFGVDMAGELTSRSARMTSWAAMLASQLVVMSACAKTFDINCAPKIETSTFCSRASYGIGLGAIGTVFSLTVVVFKLVKSVAPFSMEWAFSMILVATNTVGVILLTSAKGPGPGLGNIYYFSWLSLMVAAMLFASCLDQYKGGSSAPATSSVNANNDIPVEHLDEAI